MPYIFGKLWHLAIIWAIRKAFQCILQGVRILLAKYTRISPTSESESYLCYPMPSFASVSFFKYSRQDYLWDFNGTSDSIAKNHVMFLDIKSFWYTIHEIITFLSSKLEGFVE